MRWSKKRDGMNHSRDIYRFIFSHWKPVNTDHHVESMECNETCSNLFQTCNVSGSTFHTNCQGRISLTSKNLFVPCQLPQCRSVFRQIDYRGWKMDGVQRYIKGGKPEQPTDNLMVSISKDDSSSVNS